ncbi:hypothetical protein [Streptomyces spectabilis]|uniref:Scaffolding protein n=1 Tax=Streptomyces spectabilis TaxID=68270 RepID=A0A5P2X4A4_STRST|nr:hypothetical protein [Streptomyces spectabilis]MBB5103321.1 hypothetical protein [Streptomyces spectabilis]MCI3902512.1 hypothetical protein [Streptomyces spectabilis]QEV59847.1 hypothetical protein CP982_14785 [Streptomyces spectabilis]GGV54180.1 hypothetical protein GCM10010245_85570 [Streptomyces spectabilis]
MADDPENTPGSEPEGDQGEAKHEHQDQGDGGKPAGASGDQDRGEDEHQDQGDELSAERKARAAAEKEAARLRRANAAQRGTDLDALRTEIRGEFTAQLVRAEVRAAAAGRLRDPADALALVDVAALAGDGGDVDTAAINKAVDELLKAKPYLAAESSAGTTTPAPWGDVGSGQREDPGEPEPATPHERLRRAYGTS